MKKIQYVKLLGLLTILLFLNISCKDDDTLVRGSGITEQSWSTIKTVPLHYYHWTIQQDIQGKIP